MERKRREERERSYTASAGWMEDDLGGNMKHLS